MFKGAGVGAQIEMLSCNSTGTPIARIRSDAFTHMATTQGPILAGGTGFTQPTIA
jgi:hypothetical protein